MVDLELNEWYHESNSSSDIHVAGRAINRHEVVTNKDLANQFTNVDTISEASTKAQSLNGCFGVVIRREDDWLCITDHLRAYPVFIEYNKNSLELKDRIKKREACSQADITSQIVEAEFLTTGFVTGTETLLKSVKQLPAGSVIAINENGIVEQRTWQRCGEVSAAATTKKRVKEALTNAFERLCDIANGRQIVLPLTGGYDSRVLALLAAWSDYENILTVTHGQKNNSEAKVAKSVAKNLGLDWTFIEYSPKKWSEWYHSGSFREFRRWSYNYATLPGHVHMMWPCIQELCRKNVIESNAIFVPGHSGTSPAEHLPKAYVNKEEIHKKELIEDIVERNYWLLEYDETIATWFKDRISNVLSDQRILDPHDAARLYEEWDYRERQAKWIHKDIDCYKWFNVDWWLPLWDRELIDVWNGVPLQKRQNKRLIREIADEWYQTLGGVSASGTQVSEKDSIVRKGFYLVRDSPLDRLIRPINQKLRYRYDPSGWPGIMSRQLFEAIYTGNENRHTFFALEQTKRVDFRTGKWKDCPTDGVLRPQHLRASITS